MKKIIKASLLLVLPFIAVSCGKEGNTSSSSLTSVTTTENVTTTNEYSSSVNTSSDIVTSNSENSEATSSGPTDVGNLPFI